MGKHKATKRPYPLIWEFRYYRNKWWFFWKPTIKKWIRNEK